MALQRRDFQPGRAILEVMDPAEIFQILKDDAVKVLHSICSANLENSAMATGLEKVSFHSNPKESQC